MQAAQEWYGAPPKSEEHAQATPAKRRGVFKKMAVGFLVGASLMSASVAWAGVPTALPATSTGSASASAGASKLYGQLDGKVASASPDTRVRVIVHLKEQADLSTWPANDRPGAIRKLQNVAARTQPQVISAMEAAGSVSVYQRYWIFNGFAVEAPVSVVRQIAARDDVHYLIEDGYMRAPKVEAVEAPDSPGANWNIYQVRAPETWALGYDGTGRTLANFDSGVQGDHPALAARWRGVNGGTPQNSWYDPYNLSPLFPSDPDGHGTHTMGTIAGYQGDATGSNEIGQSKGATWIAARNYDASGKGPFSYMHAAMQWFVDPDGDPGTNDQPDAVNNSWGDSQAYQYPDLEWWQDIEAWRAVGIIPIFSNGNSGSNGYTVGNPGAYPIVVGVGAVDINRTIAGFSSRGPSPNVAPYNNPEYWERPNWNLIKPEVVAPGVAIRSSLPGSTYGNLQGTSMAAPHVTGMVGLLRQIRPDLTMNEFYNIIIETAYRQGSFGVIPNNNYGWGEIDDYAAAIYVRDAGAIRGTIMDQACNTSLAGAEVRVYKACTDANANGECGVRKLKSDSNGFYRTILGAGTYTVTVSAPGFYGQMFNTSVLSSTTSTLPIMLMKQPAGTVVGTVTDGTSAVVSATVSVDGLSNIRTTTNALGQYTLPNVPAGTFTIRADKCGYTSAMGNVTVAHGQTVTRNLTMGVATTLLFNDFENGTLSDWTVTGGSSSTGIWHNSNLRGFNSTRAARAGRPDPPYFYTMTVNTQLTSVGTWDTSAADKVWLSFNVYDDAESEYDILKAQISTDGGVTWPVFGANNSTVWGQASPVHGWQTVCLDVTRWRSAQMKLRFNFTTDGTNWNQQTFEGPSVDNVRVSTSGSPGSPVPAYTPTPGTPVACAVASPTPTSCAIQFTDVDPSHTFYPFIRCLACRGIINGYTTGCVTGNPCFRPENNVTRGQVAKIVSNAAGFSDPITNQSFEDVPVGSTFHEFVGRLAMRGIVGGYACGGTGEPCNPPLNLPYFRPNANVTRGQLAKMDSEAAGYSDVPSGQQFEDVAQGSTFYTYTYRLAIRTIMSGYACGGTGEPCNPPLNLPYFRPGNPATRGQTAKIVANTFYPNCVTPQR